MTHKHSDNAVARTQRRDVWNSIACPVCGAPAGYRCSGARGQVRYAAHKERWDRYRAKTAAELINDTQRLDWYENQHTLHYHLEVLYVVDGVVLTRLYDDTPKEKFEASNLREAIDLAMKELP